MAFCEVGAAVAGAMPGPQSAASGAGRRGAPLRFGELEVLVCADVTFRLDGGMMFGTVPRVMWERCAAPDERNRVAVAARSMLVRGRDAAGNPALVLVDTGLGDLAAGARFRELYGVADPPWRLLAELAALGVAPEAVTHVVLTHLHFDHAGGAVRGAGAGARPTFPAARYLVHGGELAYARAPDRRSQASYRAETWEPLAAAGVLDPVAGEQEVIPGLWLRAAPGHTDHHQVVTVTGGGRTLLFTADLFPFAAHLKPHYVPALDVDPRRTMATRRRYLELIAAERWLLLFQHDAGHVLARLDAGLGVVPVDLP